MTDPTALIESGKSQRGPPDFKSFPGSLGGCATLRSASQTPVAGVAARLRGKLGGSQEGWTSPGHFLTCFPAAAARDFCRNWRSLGSEGALVTPPKARTMQSAASAHWRRQDSISAATGSRVGARWVSLDAGRQQQQRLPVASPSAAIELSTVSPF